MLRRAVAACWMSMFLFGIIPGISSAGEICDGEGHHVEQGSTTILPECRAYEMVTSPNKDSGEPKAVIAGLIEARLDGIEGARASTTGDRIAWNSEYTLPGSTSVGLNYLSKRTDTGWSSENVVPPQSVENGTGCPFIIGMATYSPDLSSGVLADGFAQPGSFKGEGLSCGHDEPRLVPSEPEGFQNLFLRDNSTNSYQLVNVTPPTAPTPVPGPNQNNQYYPASFLAGSNDLRHIVFEEELQLTPDAPPGDNIYEWSTGSVRLVSILPDGTPTLGTLASSTRNTNFEEKSGTTGKFVPFNIANFRHATSGDGSRVFFEASENLYMREHPDQPQSVLDPKGECIQVERACTVQIDKSRVAGHAGGGGNFMIASENGSKVFFTAEDSKDLTSDTVGGSGQNLYEYNVETGALTDLTSVADAKVDGISGASDDGSYLYFVAEGNLTGQETNSDGAEAESGKPNLYLIHNGTTRYIATLDLGGDFCDWMSLECIEFPLLGGLTARVSANGLFIGFNSLNSLTGYSNEGPSCVPKLLSGTNLIRDFDPGKCQEVFLYDATENKLSCASCGPTGIAPTGPAMIRFPAANLSQEMRNAYPQRNVSDAGQVFFETANALVPRATNGKRNVYEYAGGRQYLLSTGIGEADSEFMDASQNGNNVFFVTAQSLLPRDKDEVYDIYDARVEGGFEEPAGTSLSCEGDSCPEAVGGAPVFSPPSSTTFNGVGNFSSPAPKQTAKSKPKPAKCKKRYVRKKDKCVRKPKTKTKKSAKGRK